MKKPNFKKAKDVLGKIPGVHLTSIGLKAWYGMDEEKQKEIIQNLIIAGAKAAAKNG